MKANLCFKIIFLLLIFFQVFLPENISAQQKSDEPEITERIIKIKGSLDKPRVIFIVPRANLWKKNVFKKNFIKDILKPVYPKPLIKELESPYKSGKR